MSQKIQIKDPNGLEFTSALVNRFKNFLVLHDKAVEEEKTFANILVEPRAFLSEAIIQLEEEQKSYMKRVEEEEKEAREAAKRTEEIMKQMREKRL